VNGVAFYCVSSPAYFLGAVGMINSLRLAGHDEPVYVLDCGLDAAQRELLASETAVVDAPPGREAYTLKTEAPLRHPSPVRVLIDADLVVTRPLTDLLERAAEGAAVAFENPIDRFVEEWGELLDLGPVERRRYLCSGLVALGEPVGTEVLELLADRQDRVEFGRGYFGANDRGYALEYADQDVLNAILAARVEADRVTALDWRLAPMPPFEGLRLVDERAMRCEYADGTRPYAVHQSLPVKPWLEAITDGIYSRLLRRALTGDDVAIRVPDAMIPPSLRRGAIGFAERQRVKARDRIRSRLG
jgi:hypothetical protein